MKFVSDSLVAASVHRPDVCMREEDAANLLLHQEQLMLLSMAFLTKAQTGLTCEKKVEVTLESNLTDGEVRQRV